MKDYGREMVGALKLNVGTNTYIPKVGADKSLGNSTISDDGSTVTVAANLTATKVSNAVYNDIADLIEFDGEIEYGCSYVVDPTGKVRKSEEYCEKGTLGIASDTYGYALGVDKEVKQIPICVGGFVLAHVDKIYEFGTALTSGENGILTEMHLSDRRNYPEKLIGIFYKIETKEIWRDIVVNKRHWVKVI